MRRVIRFALLVLVGLSTFAAGVFITRSLAVAPRQLSEPAAWQVMLSFENQDLAGLAEEPGRAVRKAVAQLTSTSADESPWFQARLFRTISSTKGEKRYLLVEAASLMMIPGSGHLRVHTFDTDGRLLKSQEFPTGNRISLVAMEIRQVPLLDQQALVVHGEYCFGGSPSHQYYVLFEDEIRLVQFVEDSKYEGVSYQRRLDIGPKVQYSFEEWNKDLHSPVSAEVMSALLWLDIVNTEETERGKFASRTRDKVRIRLVELSQSENQWIKWKATAALE